jgi:hypothetical protein
VPGPISTSKGGVVVADCGTTAKPSSGVPLGPTKSSVSARRSSAEIVRSSFESASSVTRPCWLTTPRYLRRSSYEMRALSLLIAPPQVT